MDYRIGFVREKIDIKILILYILARCHSPVDHEQLSEMALCDDGISYFDYAECLDELVASGHVSLTDGLYSITEKGLTNGSITESSVPFTVRRKASELTSRFNMEEARREKIVTETKKHPGGGFDVHLVLSDGVAQILDMTMYADTEAQAKLLSDGFRARAEKAYNALISELTN